MLVMVSKYFAVPSFAVLHADPLLMERPFSNSKVDHAGKILCGRIRVPDAPEGDVMFQNAVEVLSDWRAFHAYVLNQISSTLTNRARTIFPPAMIAQRLKRFPSIQAKLMRSENMALTQMQDIAGCRAILGTVGHALRLMSRYERYAASSQRGPQ